MTGHPKKNEEKMLKALNAWRTLTPTKKYGGMTLAEFEALVNASIAPRQRLAEIRDEEILEITTRDAADTVTMTALQLVVAGVLADPTEGPNSAVYEAMGYIRKEDRQSGLTRKKKTPGKP